MDHITSLQPLRAYHVALFPTIQLCLAPLNQWPRPLPHLSSALASSHHPIAATSHPMSPVQRPVKLHFGSEEGGDSGVSRPCHLFPDSQHQGKGGPSLVLVIKELTDRIQVQHGGGCLLRTTLHRAQGCHAQSRCCRGLFKADGISA